MEPVDFTLAVLDGTLASSIGVTVDTLNAARRIATALGRPAPTWRVLGGSACVRLTGGLMMAARPLAEVEAGSADRSTLIIPGVGIEPEPGTPPLCVEQRLSATAVAARLQQPDALALADFARRHHDAGNRVAASCAAVIILGNAGLLDGRRATTHWALNRYLQNTWPRCTADVTQMVIHDGRVVTAGAAMAQMDLMLTLLREHSGIEVADLVMRYLLLDGRPTQSRYMAITHLAAGDDTVRRLEALVEASLPEVPTLAVLAERLHVSEKTLARRVRRATGQTPHAVIQAVRLRHARHLLESTRLPVSEVASRVGYADATALRKLTLKTLQLAPGQVRVRR